VAKKADLQAAYDRCEQMRHSVAAAEQSRDYPLAVRYATGVLPDQHDAVTFQRRFLKSPTFTTPAVDVILRYAPPVFLSKVLDAVQEWFDAGSKPERTALPEMPKRIEAARHLLAHAVELWGVLAESPKAVLRPPATPSTAAVVPFWVSAGVVALRPQDPGTYARVSDPQRQAVAKCSGCGRERTAPLAALLEPTTCNACQRRCNFVLIRRVLGSIA
jgi:hypothetical protein